ncbi:uncharacterized protein [Triticum aestivum]|uniref:uncharacterized protein n=1 Tax=Triticum aestivum TaxID=4565 RepID=UPI001D018B24|nr:uncharacterized protein LOC123124162 [Triticum aestivum]
MDPAVRSPPFGNRINSPPRDPSPEGSAGGARRARSSSAIPRQSARIYILREPVSPPATEAQASVSPELPEELLMTVFGTLEIPDLVLAGSVCFPWRSAYTALRNIGKHKPTQTPCLLYTSESADEHVACLYSLVEKRVYKLTLPEPPLRSRFLIGSSLGFLVTVDDRSEMHLVNPITGQQIALPSVTTIEYVKPIFDESGSVHEYDYPSHSAR